MPPVSSSFSFPAPQSDECLIYLVRHGATASNVAKPPKVQGRGSDLPLSEAGLAQAAACARFFEGARLAAVASSPLARAHQTAEAIARPHQLVVEPIPALLEVDVGSWEGLTWHEAEARDPDAKRLFVDDPGVHPYAGGENFQQVRERALPALLALADRSLGGAVVVASHNVVNRCLIAVAMELPLKFSRRIPQHNGGVSVLRWRGGKLHALSVNSISHLPEWE
ncbi:MAG TPA: histidine phosphatase family protein [Pirellulales bacterium]